jgi:hypothetical protein
MARKECTQHLFVVQVLSMLVILVVPPLFGQVTGGTLSGTIVDKSGATIPNVSVSVTNLDTGVTRNSISNAAGFYNVPNLLAGEYKITAVGAGFQTEIRTGIVLSVGSEQVLNLTMNVGTVTDKVEVTGLAPSVQLNSSTISNVVDSTTVVELPLNGRSWTDLTSLQPGVTLIQTQANINSGDRPKRGLGQQLSISGSRPIGNNYLVDGVNINDYANNGPGSVLGGNLGVDAIAEFSVLTTNYSAEYGRTSGGVISAITRSGTNAIHGTAYEFFRDSALDARNFFDSTAIAPFRRNQFGASIGGPVKKDKTFIFGNYEGIRQSLGLSVVDTVPSPSALAGNLCAPPSCQTTTHVSPDPSALAFIHAFYPLPNGAILCPFASCPTGAGDTGIFSYSGSQKTTENYFIVRLDHKFSDIDSLSGTYLFDNAPNTQDDEFKNKVVSSRTRHQLASIEENHIFNSQFFNSARFGYNRVFTGSPQGATPINPLTNDPSYGFVPGISAGQVSVPGLTYFSGGLSAANPVLFRWNSWQAYDNLFLTKGVHSLKFGANVERIEDNSFSATTYGGIFNFNSLSDFLTNTPAVFLVTLPSSLTGRGIRQTIFGTYFQDDVRLKPYFTVNLGMRYEIASIPTEVEGKLSNLRTLTSPVAHTGSPYILNPTLHDFEPRVGFAWDPFHDGKTSVRAGFGLFDVLPLPVEMGAGVDSAVPFALNVTSTHLPVGSFPSGAFQTVQGVPSDRRAYVLQFNPPRSYVMQWNLNVQRDLNSDTTAMVAYVGSRGIHLWYQTDDANIVLPTKTPQGYFWPTPIGSGKVANPNFGRLLYGNWSSDSYYDGLELQVTKRMRHGCQLEGSYTWSKNIDTSSGTSASDQYINSLAATLFVDPRTHRGLADTNITHQFVANSIWNVPGLRSGARLAKWTTNGWQIGGVYRITTGQPFSVLIAGDPLGLNSAVPFDFPDRLSGPGCNSLVNPGNITSYIKLSCFAFPNPVNRLGNTGRNSLIGPGLSDLDFSLFKNNRISERDTLQFRVETFNALNHPNFAPPTDNNTLFDQSGNPVAGAGLLTRTTTTAREIQLGAKLIW